MKLFGLNIELLKRAEEPSSALTLPSNDDGAQVVSGASAAYYGIALNMDSTFQNEYQSIQKYREIALYPEIDIALQDIVNEAVPAEDFEQQLKIVIDDKLELSDSLKQKIEDEFEEVLELLDYNTMSSDIFRSWYVDGRKTYQIIVDKKNLKSGILEVRPIDSLKIKKVREVKKEKTPTGVDTVEVVQEYYIYNEAGFAGSDKGKTTGNSSPSNGTMISADAIVYAPSGLFDSMTGSVISYLQKAIKPVNQLRMLEDATIVYFIARAPERRIFYIDVGNLPKLKAEQYVKEIMNKYRNKTVYDPATGTTKDDKKYMSMLEDFWMPRRDGGKGTEITTLPGSSNQSSMLENIKYFQEKLYQSLNVPLSRMQPDTGFSMGRTTEISRDEVKFQKFIDKLRKKFSVLFYDLLKTQLILKGIVNDIEWDELKQHIHFSFQTDNYFSELKELDIIQQRLNLLSQANSYVGNYFSKEQIHKQILRRSDLDIQETKDQIDAEKDDPTAQVWGQQQLMQPPMMPGMGGDPNDPNAQQDPYAAPADPNQQPQQFGQQ